MMNTIGVGCYAQWAAIPERVAPEFSAVESSEVDANAESRTLSESDARLLSLMKR